MKRDLMTLMALAALFGGEIACDLEKHDAQPAWHYEAFWPSARPTMDLPHIHGEIPSMDNDGVNRISGASGGSASGLTAEGSLDVFWENHMQSAALPEYKIHFLKYVNGRNGAQRPNRIAAAANLRTYLVEIGFTPEAAALWLERVYERKSVSITNVFLPARYLGAYEPE